MYLRSYRIFSPALFFTCCLLFSIVVSACTSSSTPSVEQVPSTTRVAKTMIIWPFDSNPNNGQWAIINGYRGGADHALGGSPNDYAHLALDFVRCFQSQVHVDQGKCSLPAGWDTASTDGQVVLSPVTGHIRWIDRGAVSPPTSSCRSLGIELDTASSYYIALAHVKELYQNGDSNKPLQVGAPVTQGEHIGKISDVSGGGCYGDAHHIHMALYHLCSGCNVDSQREAVAFSGQWSISNCSFPDDVKTDNEYRETLVPCQSTVVPNPAVTLTPTAPLQFQGTLVQSPTTFQVTLNITQKNGDGSFDGKWYATVNGSVEDVILTGVIVPFSESNRFSQINQDKVQQLQQQYGSNGTLLWFTSTSYDVGQDILLGCEYYGLLHTNGSVQGIWYPPGSSTEGGTFQLA